MNEEAPHSFAGGASGAPGAADGRESWGASAPHTPGAWSYFVLPVTVKWARRFRCQHSSLDCVQTGTSLP